MAEKSQEQMRAEANARLDRLALHVTQVLAGVLPEDAPADFVLTDEVKESNNGLPWWIGPKAKDADVVLVLGDDGELEQR
jgi:hypothetical protein